MKYFTSFGYLFIFSLIAKSVQEATPTEKSMIATKIFSIAMECIITNPLTLNEIQSFKNKIFPEGQNPKCFIACIYKKLSILDDKGMLSPAGARKKAEMVFKGNNEQLKNIDNLMNSCLSVNEEKTNDGNKGCERAKLAFTCLFQNIPKYGVDIGF